MSHAGVLPLLGDVPALLQQHIHVVTIRLELFLRSSAAGLQTRTCLLIKISAGELLVRLDQQLQFVQHVDPHGCVGVLKGYGERIRKSENTIASGSADA